MNKNLTCNQKMVFKNCSLSNSLEPEEFIGYSESVLLKHGPVAQWLEQSA